ncbi:MAG: hypothetical protein US54_C0044G0006 [Candidatus Roizmanbacteria bacterium GW2011_GWA2_37_7]|uniref:HEAT repeat domain-containing protein n=1 Tax=Candidatus Roizmanbacteria bacterium GW2011_GWA2_37_7 TaxID=1618481 RepID=A0A0G0H4S1_9BACT|nr:MAG: hypothetical protein US54_C0044G0006 [Candidatus Roizmanbacteria bacterium GW2011_GWA2_37_7]
MVENQQVSLAELRQFAAEGKWELVDQNLPALCNDSQTIEWSLHEGINAPDGNIRDLSVTILEFSDYVLNPEDKEKLIDRLQNDENLYVRYRAAFALYKRGNRSPEVMSKMKEALFDDDVKAIVEGYLLQKDG